MVPEDKHARRRKRLHDCLDRFPDEELSALWFLFMHLRSGRKLKDLQSIDAVRDVSSFEDRAYRYRRRRFVELVGFLVAFCAAILYVCILRDSGDEAWVRKMLHESLVSIAAAIFAHIYVRLWVEYGNDLGNRFSWPKGLVWIAWVPLYFQIIIIFGILLIFVSLELAEAAFIGLNCSYVVSLSMPLFDPMLDKLIFRLFRRKPCEQGKILKTDCKAR